MDLLRQLGEETRAFELVECEKASSRNHIDVDARVTIRPTGESRPLTLSIEIKKRLTPREAMALVASLRQTGKDELLVVCCPYISPRVAALLSSEGVGYVDQGGNARIAGHGFFLQVTGRPNPQPDTRPLNNPFSRKASRVVRLMLEEPDRPWHVQELAREAEVSIGLVSKAKHALEEEGYLWFIGGFLRLNDPAGLLEAWRGVYANKTEAQRYYVMAGEREIEQNIADWCKSEEVSYALADFSGAWQIAPMVRQKQVSACLANTLSRDQRKSLLDHLGAKSVDSGANLSLRFEDDPFVFYRSEVVDGISVLSPLQLYLNLISKAGRGEEAAAALYDQHLRPRFEACREAFIQSEEA